MELSLFSPAASFSAALRPSWSFLNRSRTSSVPSMGSSIPSSSLSSSSWTEGANLEKRVSSSSGSSTFVMIRTIHSELSGIASIISGMSSASKPHSKDACCIMSRNRFFAFSVPYASSLIFNSRSARSSRVSVQRIWFSFTFSIFMLSHPYY